MADKEYSLERELLYLPPAGRTCVKAEPLYSPEYISAEKSKKMTLPTQVMSIRPGKTIFLPLKTSTKTYNFVLDNLRKNIVRLQDLKFEGETQKKAFLDYAVSYFSEQNDFVGSGKIRSHNGDSEAALDDFYEALRQNPANFEAFLGSGLAKRKLGIENYLDDIKTAMNFAPQDKAQNIKSYVEQEEKNLEQLLILFGGEKKNIQMSGEDAYVLRKSATTKTYDSVIANSSNHVIKLGNIKFEGGPKQEQSFFKYALDQFAEKEDFVNSGEVKFKLNDYDAALFDFNKAIKKNSSDAKAWIGRGLAKKMLGDEDYNNDIKQAIKLFPPERAKEVNERLAACGLIERETETKGVEHIIASDVDVNISLTEDGKIMVDDDASDSTYEYLVNNINQNKFRIQDLLFSDQLKAQKFLMHADHSFYTKKDFVNIGAVRTYLHDFENALEFLDIVKELQPDNYEAYKWAGIARYSCGQTKDALADLQKVKELCPAETDWINYYIDKTKVNESKVADLKGAAKGLIAKVFPPKVDRAKQRRIAVLKAAYKQYLNENAEKINSYENQLADNRKRVKKEY